MTGIQDLLATLHEIGANFSRDDNGEWRLRAKKGMELTSSQRAMLKEFRSAVVEALEPEPEEVAALFSEVHRKTVGAGDSQRAYDALTKAQEEYDAGNLQAVYWSLREAPKMAAEDKSEDSPGERKTAA